SQFVNYERYQRVSAASCAKRLRKIPCFREVPGFNGRSGRISCFFVLPLIFLRFFSLRFSLCISAVYPIQAKRRAVAASLHARLLLRPGGRRPKVNYCWPPL